MYKLNRNRRFPVAHSVPHRNVQMDCGGSAKAALDITALAMILMLGAPPAWANEVSDCAQRLHLEQAIDACTQIIERSGGEVRTNLEDTYKSRADAYFASGEYDRAIADLGKAITLNAEDANAYVRRGMAYEAEGDHQDAIADFSTVIRLKPTYASGYTMRGGAYEMVGEKHRAIADFRIALALDPCLETVKSAIRRLGGAV